MGHRGRRFVRAALATLVAGAATCVILGTWPLVAQSDLDALMREVIEARDENWTKLQQYVLDEQEEITVRGPDGATLWGERRDYAWYIRDSLFVRSPRRVNGAAVSEVERRRSEDAFIERETERERRRRNDPTVPAPGGAEPPPSAGNDVAALMSQGRQPQFISSAYFLRFRFEAGRYAFVGRESIDGREALKVEYYPEMLFREASRRPRPDRRQDDAASREVRRLMSKASVVTLWVEPAARQILRYTFDNVSLDFLPTQWFARVTDVRASMTMGEPFPEVWLPNRIEVTVSGMLATGRFDLRYDTRYTDYRRADVGSRVVAPDGR